MQRGNATWQKVLVWCTRRKPIAVKPRVITTMATPARIMQPMRPNTNRTFRNANPLGKYTACNTKPTCKTRASKRSFKIKLLRTKRFVRFFNTAHQFEHDVHQNRRGAAGAEASSASGTLLSMV